MEWIRHGDVILEKISKKIRGKKTDAEILAYGETTGHKHVLKGQLAVMKSPQGKTIEVLEDAQLVHEEHDTLEIPKGTYRIRIQREYSILGGVRQVQD